ncbi:MAG: hypothetical protein AAGA99_19590 [Actinomycetota bacterium]
MATEPNDDELLDLATHAIEHSFPVPDDAVAVAKAAFGLGSVEAELAQLVYDSLHDESQVLLRSGDERHRALSFAAGPINIEIELLDDQETIVGQIEPPGAIEVSLETPDGRSPVEVDALGRFRSGIRPGPFRICLSSADASTVTPWITT